MKHSKSECALGKHLLVYWHCWPEMSLVFTNMFCNRLTLGRKRGGGGIHPPKDFPECFGDELPSSPIVFSSCANIPYTHFDTRLVSISCYGYEIWRHLSSRPSSYFLRKMHVFFSFFRWKSTKCGQKVTKCLIVTFLMSSKKNQFPPLPIKMFNFGKIQDDSQDGGHIGRHNRAPAVLHPITPLPFLVPWLGYEFACTRVRGIN